MSGYDGNHEGALSTRPPLLTGVNYTSWKGKMEAYVCQIHDRAWMAIEDGYAPPMMTPTGGGEEVLKPKAQWSTEEFETSKWNRKAWHALLCAVDENQYKLIQNTRIAKEAWDILEVAHKGTDVVKDSELQVLQTQFELLKMEEDKCFNDFEVKLMDIVNQSHQLGDPYSDRRVKQKIMRSLPARFESKVTALDENSTYKDMKPSEVIGRLLAYESRKAPSISPPKKQKRIALKTSKVEKEEKGDSDEDTALLLRRFKKFVKFEKKGFGSKGQDLKKKAPFKSFEPRQEKSEKKGLTIDYTAFGATCVEDKVVGKNDLTRDLIVERDEASPVHTSRKKIDLGQCSRSAHVKEAPRRQPQAQRIRVSQVNILQQMTLNGKRPIMQNETRKQTRPIQQQRRFEPAQPQSHGKAPMHAQGHGMNSKFIPTCHLMTRVYQKRSDPDSILPRFRGCSSLRASSLNY
ncbi:hypothetical protein Q3G72_020482 [Acer saccharum]|nr:hypothetical protein Q3G72_020482 [Acer saccharum]